MPRPGLLATMRRAGGPYEEAVLADNPVAYWRMDDASGTTMVDSSGSGLDGTYYNTPTLGATKLAAGTAVTFDRASSEYAAVAHDAALNASGAFTVEMWVKIADPTADALQVIADKTSASASNGQWLVFWENRTSQGSPLRLRALFGSNASGILDWSGASARDALSVGGHLCVTASGTGTGVTMTIWWNGVAVATSSDRVVTWSASNTKALGLSYYAAFYAGLTLDEIALYATELSEAQILAHYNAREV